MLILVILGAASPLPAIVCAATYYVDATGGSDQNGGTSDTSAWKTIATVNDRAFLPGDHVLFKRGELWREELKISSSGSSGNPITFGSYGTGPKPTISGADPVTGWTRYRGSIYMAGIGNVVPPTQLYIDGAYFDPAHYPNRGYLLATANSADYTSITDANLTLSASQLVGAMVQARTVPWSISTATVTAYDATSHTLTLDTPVSYRTMRKGYGFYLVNMLWMLDAPGEWFYDPAAGRLYLWMPGSDSPAAHTVEIATRGYGIINKKSYVTIRDLAVAKADVANVYIHGAREARVDALDVREGQLGILVTDSVNSTVSNCFVQNPLGNGIQLSGPSNSGITVTGNTVNGAGNVGTPKQSDGGLVISSTATDVTVANNVITNTGNNGVHMNGDRIVVKDNVIDRTCLVLDDCGGIYSYGRDLSKPTRKHISGNRVSNSVGNTNGTTFTGTQAEGIYLDDGAHDTNVFNNTVSNSDLGIYIHTGHHNTVTGNTVSGPRVKAILVEEASPSAASSETGYNNVHGNFLDTGTKGTGSSD